MDIKGYKIHRKIGEGAMASVYLAVQESLGRQVALKVLAPTLACQPGFTKRFFHEAQIVARLNHPRIVGVYDLGESHPNHFMAMEFLPGGTLQQRIKNGMPPNQAVQYIKEIGMALDYAHQQGVVHRDIKPQNIMFRDGHVPVLTDFGIARLMDGDLRLTHPGRTVGSPLYMSPEQISGGHIDTRSDLYSVGILFYEMLTQTLPYHSDQFVAVALMHKTDPIPTLPDHLSLFQPLLDKLLAKDPNERYSSVQAFNAALAQIASDSAIIQEDGSLAESDDVGQYLNLAKGDYTTVAGQKGGLTGDITQPALKPPAIDMVERKVHAIDSPLEPAGPTLATANDRSHAGTHVESGRKTVIILTMLFIALAVVYYVFNRSAPEAVTSSLPLSSKASSTLAVNNVSYPEPTDELSASGSYQPTPVITPTAPAPEGQQRSKDQKVEMLLAKAQAQIAMHHLTSPVGDNSYETYQQVLSLDPSGKSADTILIQIGKAYGRLALAAKANGRWQEGLAHIAKGLEVRPEDEALNDMKVQIQAGLAEQRRASQERARQIEQLEQLRAAQLAADKKRREVEQELKALRKQAAERERRERQRADQIKREEPAEVTAGQPETKEEDRGSRNRLFGTF